jgi:hypothetical protein
MIYHIHNTFHKMLDSQNMDIYHHIHLHVNMVDMHGVGWMLYELFGGRHQAVCQINLKHRAKAERERRGTFQAGSEDMMGWFLLCGCLLLLAIIFRPSNMIHSSYTYERTSG